MLILGSRLALFAMFQMLIAGGLAAAGMAAPCIGQSERDRVRGKRHGTTVVSAL
jgi:hypothetical protein